MEENGDLVSAPGGPEFLIFDEKGEQFAATYILCPVLENSQPHQVDFHYELNSIIQFWALEPNNKTSSQEFKEKFPYFAKELIHIQVS